MNRFISNKLSQKLILESKFNDNKEKEPDNSLTCSSGSCSFVQRPNSSSSNGAKILSGEGSTYFPAIETKIKPKFITPPKKIMKLVGQAIKEWNMIEEGDRLLLGLSGGKDSLALLHVLLAMQKRAPIKFTIACATVDPQTDSFDPSPLIPYIQSLGITYHYLSEPIVELAKTKLQGDSLCAFCSRFKRGLLYACCRNFKYNKLVLAQHLDDLAESFMMSALHNGQIRTMKANYTIEAGDVRVIRPFVHVREHMTRDFSQESKLPIINENCPACFEQPKERARIKKLLMQEESMIPALYYNLRRAFIPLLHDDTYIAMNNVVKLVEELGQDSRQRNKKDKNGMKRHVEDNKNEVDGDNNIEPANKKSKGEECIDGLCYELA
jgi:tRNA(Ile)-lysidine synthase TilS/MesJ